MRTTKRSSEAVVLGKHGEYGKGRPKDRVSIRNSILGGTNSRYTLARLNRDRPDLAEPESKPAM
jgi:hypothetical protein